jgi:hypothetical protein
MPVSVKGGIELRTALKKFTPDLAKETQKEIGRLLKPITQKARGFIPASAPLSGWSKDSIDGKFPQWSSSDAKRGIGYKTTPSKPNRQGWRSLARIVNASAAGSIYETAGRVNPNGREQNAYAKFSPRSENYGKKIRETDRKKSRSNNPMAGKQFIDALNATGQLVDARSGDSRGNMRGRAIFRAWKEDGGKTQAAVLKAIEASRDKFNKAVGAN